MTDTREAADPFGELAKKNYAYVMVRMNKSDVREFFDGFLVHVPWVRAVSSQTPTSDPLEPTACGLQGDGEDAPQKVWDVLG